MKNPDYKADITLTKGGKQFVNIITSAAFSSFLVVVFKEITDKEFKISDIQQAIDQITPVIILLLPFISSCLKMGTNFISNYYKKIR